ncbi:peptide deformylase [Catenulispora acidiphila DSM 44928]|uniref:Peptide deformylase n=1 Tax=Catenulispora acidiphila (strain DSM 44928 / JCM 14897 / NBRC 102108 / NRRL B-24433 / ID139908) TaxID=479433 RepID=C7Q4T3_CATAD|nr:peptide deformylase [Catenulispora acidiphila]ACU73881.1 peptide deformylase [Catenulispora acidiphila DSM 44928]
MVARPGSTAKQVLVQGRPVDGYPALAPEAARGKELRVTVVGEEVLHRPCREVAEFGTAELLQLVDDMFLTMYVAQGVGLAANQVGVDLRVFVYDCVDDDGARHVGHIVNPKLDRTPEGGQRRLVEAQEGCLSVPGPTRELPRYDHAVLHGVDVHGEPLVLEGEGYFARCLQHETDHLEGTLYIDRMNKKTRRGVLEEMAEVADGVFAERKTRAEELREHFATPSE